MNNLSIISTVGTSVFGRPQTPLNEAMKALKVTDSSEISNVVSRPNFLGDHIYQQALAQLHVQGKDKGFLRAATAEINAIEGIHEAKQVLPVGHEYHFLATSTIAGALAARTLADFCKEHYQAAKSKVHVITGLQIEDDNIFRRVGLPSFVQTVYSLLKEAKENQSMVVLNPTGGYKAAISYLTLVGMLRQSQDVQVCYIHETSKSLITLAGLPVTLDLNSVQPYKAILEQCDKSQDTGLARSIVFEGLGLTANDRLSEHPCWSLFEQYGENHFMLSGLGSIVLAELNELARCQPVWLSKQAAARYDSEYKSGSIARSNFDTIFNRIGDPDNRVPPYFHPYKGSKYPAFKYRGNERLFYKEFENGVLILELAQHKSDINYSYDRVPDENTDYTPYRAWTRTS